MMYRGSNARHFMGLALSVGLAATAGCQAAQPTAPGETQFSQTVGQTQSASAQAASDLGLTKMPIQVEEFKLTQPGDKPLAKALVVVGDQVMVPDERGVIRLPKSAAMTNGKTMVSVQAEGFVPVTTPIVGGAALQLTPLDAARTSISAASGGVARNADGTMEVTFAPGSLDKDAQVSVTRIYNDQLNSYFTPPTDADKRTSLGQYSYHLDLNGAEITSAANVVVKFKVQDELKAHFTEVLKGSKGIEGSNIKDDFSQDTQGNYWFAMKNPAALPKPAEALAAAFSLLAQACPAYPDDHYIRNDRNVIAYNIGGNCDNRGDGGVNFHDSRFNSGHCQYWVDSRYECEGKTLVEYSQTRVNVPSSGVVAKVTWQSDDGRISGPVPSALVSFSHAGTAVRGATSAAYTDGSGEAAAVGAQGANGAASATYSSQPWTIGTSAGYRVDCGGQVPLKIIKNKPVVKFNFAQNGTATAGGYALPTSHGTVSVGNLSGPTAAVTMASTSSATEQFTVAGTWQPSSDVWIDAQSTSPSTIQWNNMNTGGNPNAVATRIWFSKQIGAGLTYLSNDDSGPADQRPIIQWNTLAARANVAFSHDVSSYAAKGHADTLSFNQAAGSASTWGLNGAAGSVTATVTGPEATSPVTLTGTKPYTVNGGQVGVSINANLPEITIAIREMETEDNSFRMDYVLDGQAKSMVLAKSGNSLQFSIPVEDQLNQPRKHTFQIKWLGTVSGNTTFWMANRAAYPTLTVARAGRYEHPALDGALNAAK